MTIKRFPFGGNKYLNRKTKYDDITFDSVKEKDTYKKLKAMEERGEIQNLECQVAFVLIPSQYETVEVQLKNKTKTVRKLVEKSVSYIADFVYEKDGETCVVDCKSPITKTAVYIVKRKLMLYKYGIKIKEV